MCTFVWRCDTCEATFDQADALGTHRRLAHHPLTPAIEYLAASITARVLNGGSVTVLASNDAPERWQDGAIADRALDSRFRHVFTGTRSYRQVKRGRGEA
jgi:hypothetical protein